MGEIRSCSSSGVKVPKSVYLVTFLESLLLQIQKITLRQNGKHRRPRPREGRVGDVRSPGSKLPEHGQPGSTRGGATRLSAGERGQGWQEGAGGREAQCPATQDCLQLQESPWKDILCIQAASQP